MSAPIQARIADDEVYALTALGEAQLKEARTSLSREALKVLVVVDGKSSAAELMRGMPVMSPADVREHLGTLLAGGMIHSARRGAEGVDYIDAGDFFKTIGRPVRLGAADAAGHPEAASGLASLKEDGYFVRIARRAQATPQKPKSGHRVALVVDDDPDIGNLLKTVLRLENFDVVVAANKTEVLDALRRPTPPDLALLDVQLPDVDGFHILSRMRQHPTLKSVPIIMLTVSATRADVLKGLHFGADGYVTKPFDFEVLVKAVRTVLGLDEAGPKDAKPG
jgi:CheY-like chemotaxis protein